MKIKLEGFNLKQVKNRILSDDVKLEATQQVKIYADKYTPRREGDLMSSGRVTPGEIEYQEPYARRLYFGDTFKFSTQENELATSRWVEKAYNANKNQITLAIENFIKNK